MAAAHHAERCAPRRERPQATRSGHTGAHVTFVHFLRSTLGHADEPTPRRAGRLPHPPRQPHRVPCAAAMVAHLAQHGMHADLNTTRTGLYGIRRNGAPPTEARPVARSFEPGRWLTACH
eukprot:364743-Chlamydomonas_euryale.AAC.26